MKLLAESEDYFDKPNWTNFNGHETPFGAIAELLNLGQVLRKHRNKAMRSDI